MNDTEKLLRRVTIASVTVASILVLTKLAAWMLGDSVAVLSSLSDSAGDWLISVMNFTAIRYALKPADDDHRFGHGKAEDLAALAQAVFITALSGFVIIEAAQHLNMPTTASAVSAPEHLGDMISISVMTLSLTLTIALVLFQRHVHRVTNSNLVHADALHYMADILSNIAIIISLVVAMLFSAPYLDPIMGLLIALYLLHGAWHVGKSAFDNLMDKEMEDEKKDEIAKIIKSHPKVVKLTSLRTRYSGTQPIIQFDFTMDGSVSLNEAHDVAHEIEKCLLGEYPEAQVFMHQEPDEE